MPGIRPPGTRLAWASGLLLLLAVLLAVSCATNRFERPRVGTSQRGLASWYGEPFHGRATASGEIYDMHGMTAAHKELPLGTVVDVFNLDNGRQARVRVNDRGPFIRGRILDLSYAAAKQLGVVGPGTAKIELTVVHLGGGPSGPNMATRFTVQVGAFRDEGNARRIRGELSREFSHVEVASRDGWHRVRVGKYGRKDAAETALAELRRRGYSALILALD